MNSNILSSLDEGIKPKSTEWGRHSNHNTNTPVRIPSKQLKIVLDWWHSMLCDGCWLKLQ